ncbi:amino acid antiporter [Legionella hackeliae]|nr:amino acid antiporter [Legionella hackeliae]
MNALIAIGCIGTANNWIIAPIKGLSFAINEGVRYTKLIEKNARQVPARLLILQAGFVSIISLLFLVFPAINTSYWVMLNSATQVYLLMYFMLCLSAIKLIFNRKSYSWIILLSAFLGLSGISIGLIVSLVPPPSLPINSHFIYGLLSIFFLVFLILAPLTSLGRKPIQA